MEFLITLKTGCGVMILNKIIHSKVLILAGITFLSLGISAQEFSVGKEIAHLKSKSSFLSKKIQKVKYGDKVLVTKTKGSWHQVEIQTKEGMTSGWLHKSEIGDKKLILADIGKGEEVAKGQYSENVTLAGKGFSPEHEEAYKESNKDLDFKSVDRIIGFNATTNSVIKFAKDGKLNIDN